MADIVDRLRLLPLLPPRVMPEEARDICRAAIVEITRLRERYVAQERENFPTAGMIEAGAKLLNACAEGCLGVHRSTHVAEAVFRAMCRDAL